LYPGKSGSYSPDTDTNALNKMNIVYPGYIDGKYLPAIYTNAIASIYPSSYEGFGFPVLESMSCGTRVIIPRNSSLPEVGGEIADYYEEKNDESLSDKMSELFQCKDSDSEIESKLLKWSGKFSWENFAVEFYKTIADI
jgi:glycosyltransferase involved in cell wall biosynthesis